MKKTKQPPPRLIEALQHIDASGSLLPMRDVTVPQLDRLWDYIDAQKLAVMNHSGAWSLTDRGDELVSGGS